MNKLHGKSSLTIEKKNRLMELRKKYKVTWEWGNEEATEVFDQAIANFLNRHYGRTVVRLKRELSTYR